MNAPGKAHRSGISLVKLFEMFPDEKSAREWFESCRWPEGVRCARCNSSVVNKVKSGKPMPWRCSDCKKYFSVKMGTFMAESKIPLRKWAIGIFLFATSLKGVSSMKLHRDLDVTQKTAWFMAHRIREALEADDHLMAGPVEMDETYVGGKYENMHAGRRKQKPQKTIVAGAKDRETGEIRAGVIDSVSSNTLLGLAEQSVEPGALVNTDEARSYNGLRGVGFNHAAVNHSAGLYAVGDFHTQGIESFWSMVKRGYIGTFHHWSHQHAQRYINEFAMRATLRELDTLDIMAEIVARSIGKRLTYERLVG